MKAMPYLLGIVFSLTLFGCTVVSPRPTDKAPPLPPVDQLMRQSFQYVGETVVSGGYVLTVENFEGHTRIVALEAPLGSSQRPKSKDLSRGRLILRVDGFIDPEVYTKDRQITVGGRILAPDPQSLPVYPHLLIQVDEIHLWPVPKPVPRDPYFWDDPWCGHPFWPSPWHFRPYCY